MRRRVGGRGAYSLPFSTKVSLLETMLGCLRALSSYGYGAKAATNCEYSLVVSFMLLPLRLVRCHDGRRNIDAG